MNLIKSQKVGFQKAGFGQVRCKIGCKYGKRKTKMALSKAKKYVFCNALLEIILLGKQKAGQAFEIFFIYCHIDFSYDSTC